MKITIDQPNQEDIIVEDILGPNNCFYEIRQGENKIIISEYQLKQLKQTLAFIKNI